VTLTAGLNPSVLCSRHEETMVGTLVALTALAIGSPSPSTPNDGYALVQLTRDATCVETVPLLEAGATPVAPSLRLFRLPAATARRLAPGLQRRGALQRLEPDRPVAAASAAETQPDPLEAGEWWRSAIGADGLTPPGPGKPITVVDSGVDLQHPEFLNRPDTVALNSQEPAPLGGEHGTAVASLAAAPANGVGIVGVYPHGVLRSWDSALGQGTRIDTSELVKGIVTAADNGPGVINLSVGGTERNFFVEQAIDQAFAKGSLVVVASGNEGDRGNPAEYPADYPHVLTVGATDRSNAIATFSSRSPFVDLVAPGQDVTVATASDSSWQSESGTSFSTPIVAGAAAWVWTARPELDNTQLFEVMRRSARDIPPTGRDDASGSGLLDVAGALVYPAPIPDPGEPNDDVAFVKPSGNFYSGLDALTATGRPRAAVRARLDRLEDPKDVYRVWLPAGRSTRVTATSSANVELRVWGPGTVSVDASGAAPLGEDARARPGRKLVVVKAPKTGRWGYVEVTLGGRRGTAASYALSVGA
jgi:subtilisin family serine protease